MATSHDLLRQKAADHNQDHLFQYWEQLNEAERYALLADIARIDFPCLTRLVGESLALGKTDVDADRIRPPTVYPASPPASQRQLYEDARGRGEQMLADSQVAAMVVAGGQGTRLGFDGPKGTFPITPVKHKTLFEVFADTIRALTIRYQCKLPWYVMTSDATHDATIRYFKDNAYLGLDPGEVRFFQQGVMPAVDKDGRIILAEPHRIALSPNGHGGILAAMKDNGILDELGERGVDAISYFQVDNPLVAAADPLFLGLHDLTEAEISSIAVPKADDLEKVGNFVEVDGKLQIIEYSDLPHALARRRNADGTRFLDAGNVAIHILSRRFATRLTGGGAVQLPWHQANKKVPYWDRATGAAVNPEQPNATKFEMFFFDAVPLANKAIILEQPRSMCFSPVKNAEGVDSADTARRDMVLRAVSWLDACGVQVPRNQDGSPAATVEISPLVALDPTQLRDSMSERPVIQKGDRIFIG